MERLRIVAISIIIGVPVLTFIVAELMGGPGMQRFSSLQAATSPIIASCPRFPESVASARRSPPGTGAGAQLPASPGLQGYVWQFDAIEPVLGQSWGARPDRGGDHRGSAVGAGRDVAE
jgi:hypothetical protein